MADSSGGFTLLCGSSGPVGQGIARVLDRAGHRLALQYKSTPAAVNQLLPTLDPDRGHVTVEADFTTLPGARALVADALRAAGDRLTGVVNAAWPSGPDLSIEKAVADPHVFEASLVGYHMHAYLSAAVLPALRESHGALVFIGAASSIRVHPELGLFGASKAAATVLSRVLALEEGSNGVRVNVVAPGHLNVTGGNPDDSGVGEARLSLEEISSRRRPLPLPTPDQLGDAVAWLLSPGASGVTGQVISIAGGEPI